MSDPAGNEVDESPHASSRRRAVRGRFARFATERAADAAGDCSDGGA